MWTRSRGRTSYTTSGNSWSNHSGRPCNRVRRLTRVVSEQDVEEHRRVGDEVPEVVHDDADVGPVSVLG